MFTNNLSLSSLDVNLKWTDLQQLLVKEGIDLPTRLNSSSTAIATIVLVICLILGCLLIFRGERLFRLWMVLCGALVGSICGRFIARLINPSSPSLIIIGIFTLIGIGLFATLMRGFIVTAGFATGALFAWTFVHPGTPQILGVSSVLVCGLAGGILASLAYVWFIRGITASAGSWLVINVVRTFLLQRPWFAERLKPTSTSAWSLWLLIPLVLLTIWGVKVQRREPHLKKHR